MAVPAWARERIVREAEAYLARPDSRRDDTLDPHIRHLTAWPVYSDPGGVLLLAADGSVYSRNNNTMEVCLEPDPRWRALALAAAAEKLPELRPLLPERPAAAPDCRVCAGRGQIQATPHIRLWCGTCWGLGWPLPEARQGTTADAPSS